LCSLEQQEVDDHSFEMLGMGLGKQSSRPVASQSPTYISSPNAASVAPFRFLIDIDSLKHSVNFQKLLAKPEQYAYPYFVASSSSRPPQSDSSIDDPAPSPAIPATNSGAIVSTLLDTHQQPQLVDEHEDMNDYEDGADSAATPKPRKRAQPEDSYDKADPFIDDTEEVGEVEMLSKFSGFFATEADVATRVRVDRPNPVAEKPPPHKFAESVTQLISEVSKRMAVKRPRDDRAKLSDDTTQCRTDKKRRRLPKDSLMDAHLLQLESLCQSRAIDSREHRPLHEALAEVLDVSATSVRFRMRQLWEKSSMEKLDVQLQELLSQLKILIQEDVARYEGRLVSFQKKLVNQQQMTATEGTSAKPKLTAPQYRASWGKLAPLLIRAVDLQGIRSRRQYRSRSTDKAAESESSFCEKEKRDLFKQIANCWPRNMVPVAHIIKAYNRRTKPKLQSSASVLPAPSSGSQVTVSSSVPPTGASSKLAMGLEEVKPASSSPQAVGIPPAIVVDSHPARGTFFGNLPEDPWSSRYFDQPT